MKLLLAEIKEWKQGWLQYLKYSYKLTMWLYLGRWKRFLSSLGKHFGWMRRLSFLVIGLGIGLIVNYFGGLNFTQDILSNYLVALGAMTGGTIAIVFTISIFLIQSAAELYSSQYFEVFIHDWKEKFVYFVVIIITLLFLGGGLYVGSLTTILHNISSGIVLLSLVLVGAVFALIDWQYKNVRQKLNPSEAISFLEKEGVRFLNKLQSDAERLADLLHTRNPSITNDMGLAQAYNQFLQPFMINLDRQIENLVEISLKLSDKQEVGTTKRGFTAVYRILIRFFEARKTSSLILPSGTVFLAVESDSQTFVNKNLERLNKAGEKFIKDGKDELATYIIDIYRGLAGKAQEITFISQRNENPILDLILGNLNFYIESGQRAKNIEVVYKGLQVLRDIAVIASQKGLSLTLHGLLDKIMSVAIYGLSQKQTIIVDLCSTTFLRIISAVFTSPDIDRQIHIKGALKNIATIANHINNFIKAGLLPDDIQTRFSLSKGYDEFYTTLAVIMEHYSKITDTREKDRYKRNLIEFFRELNMSLRILSETVKSCDTTLTDSIGRLLFNINNLIVDLIQDDDFKKDVTELKSRLAWNIHLPSFFVSHAEKFDGGSNPFNTLTDSVAKTGIIVAEKLEDKALVQDCINCLYSITKDTLQKTTRGYGYNEPRVLEKACYLGIIALKKGWMDIFADLKIKITEFEAKYFAKHLTNLPAGVDPEDHNVLGLPHKDQLKRELWRWRDDYERESINGSLSIRDDAEAMMYQVVEQYDIDKFIFEVWGSFIVDSKFGKEMEEKIAREKSKKPKAEKKKKDNDK